MAETYTLDAQPRAVTGKKVSQVRQQGLVPAVIYGSGRPSIHVQIPQRALQLTLLKAGGTHLIEINVDGKAQTVIAREVQRHVLRGDILHVDFLAIDVNKVIIFTFVLGGSTAGIGGVLYAFVFKQVYFFMGFFPGIKAFSAAVLGGIGNVPGAMLGGFFLGVVESLGPALFLDGLGIVAPYQLRDLIAFTMLVMVLIFRPQGILGERLARQRA